MSPLRGWMGGRRGRGGASVVVQIGHDVLDRRRSVQGALYEVRHPAVLDALGDEDFGTLDALVASHAEDDRELAIVLARLTHAAARAKGFDRQIVDAALRLDDLLPADDLSPEREQLLRDAYVIAQRTGYLQGGRLSLGRLGHRAAEAGDTERARVFLTQQLELGPEADDTGVDLDAALLLGDLLYQAGDVGGAQNLYRRAGRSAQRLDDPRGIAEALGRQIELLGPDAGLDTLAALQRQALDAARRAADLGLQGRLHLQLAETLARNGKPVDAVDQLTEALDLARQTGDLSLESRVLTALVELERRLGHAAPLAERQRALLDLEDRLGNRAAAANWATQLGATYLSAGRAEEAASAYERARLLAVAVGDPALQQRAIGGLGVALTVLRRPVEALDRLMAALELARHDGDLAHQAQWLGSIGQALWTFDQPDDAIDAIGEALAIARRIDDVELQAGMLALLGRIYAAQGETSRAREPFTRALDLYRRLGHPGEQIQILSALASLALETRQVGQATQLYEQALRIANESGDRDGAARLHGRLGRLAQRGRDLPAMLDHYRRAVELAESLGQAGLLSRALQHLAAAQDLAGQPGAAETYRRALDLCQELGDAAGEARLRLNLGTLLSGNGHRDEGLSHLRRALSLASRLGPEGAPLRERAEAAMVAAGADPYAADWRPAVGAPRSGSIVEPRPGRPRRPGDEIADDAVFDETPLPPT